MKKILFLLAFAPMILKAQILTGSSTQLNFGNTTVGTVDSLSIQITNTESYAISITGFKFYTIYNALPFYVKTAVFSIPSQGTQSVWVYFEPIHNILHNSEMIIQHTGTSGFEPIDLVGQGKFPNAYYNSTENLSEEALKTALKTRLGQGYNSLSYSAARDNMYASIDNNGGSVECAYTGRTANFTTRAGANSNNFNCEHTFPQGFFSQNLPMRSDIHHLFSTDVTANSQRGNLPFGVVSGSGTWSQGGSKKGSGAFEPRNAQKGRTARAMMYFVLRYQDYANHFSGQESILKNWHNTYPPDAIDIQRNNDIFAIQNNRNPFIDYPQLEQRISNFVSLSTAPQVFGLDILQSNINFGNVTANSPDTFDYVLVNRGSRVIQLSNLSLSNPSELSFGGASGSASNLVPGESIQISVIINTSRSNVSETLSFSTNIPGSQSNFSIPILASAIFTNISELDLEQSIELYPNPAKNFAIIQSTQGRKIEYVLRDALGKILLRNTSTKETQQLNLTGLSSGVYFIEISQSDQKTVQKLIIH